MKKADCPFSRDNICKVATRIDAILSERPLMQLDSAVAGSALTADHPVHYGQGFKSKTPCPCNYFAGT
jgi:hypothetical protein